MTGEEDPATTFAGVTTVTVEWVDGDAGAHTLAANVPWPASSISLGSVDETTVGEIQVKGRDDAGTPLVFGSVIPLEFGAFNGATAGDPVPVFVQRVGEFARVPQPNDGGLGTGSRTTPLLGLVGGRYLIVTGGDDPTTATSSQLYDLLTLAPLPYPPALPSADSMAIVGTTAYLIAASGATTFDLSGSGSSALSLPAGEFTADSIAGGATISATDGTQYIVGGTRTAPGAPTAAVLCIDTTGAAHWITLANARLGAAAAWSDTKGLIVAGGSAEVPGVELIPTCTASTAATGTSSTPLMGFAADPSVGAGAETLDDDHLLVLAGGSTPDQSDPGVRVLDLTCTSACAAKAWASLPRVLTSAQAYAMPGQASAVVVGSEPTGGATHAFLLAESTATEIPTRVSHTHARTIASPLGITPGSFFLVGGAPEIESFFSAFK